LTKTNAIFKFWGTKTLTQRNETEYLYFYELEVDGLFTENVARAQEARTIFQWTKKQSLIVTDDFRSPSNRRILFLWNTLLFLCATVGGLLGWGITFFYYKTFRFQQTNEHLKPKHNKQTSQTKKLLTAPAQ
jgi:hypothetical protein